MEKLTFPKKAAPAKKKPAPPAGRRAGRARLARAAAPANAAGGALVSLPQFLAQVRGQMADPGQRRLLVDQALLLLEQLYVHLPQKRAMYGIDPLQRLKLLRYRIEDIAPDRFHKDLASIFLGLRDLHTVYLLPEPYARARAVLPFLIEEFFDAEDGQFCYAVSKIREGTQTEASFQLGVAVTHWNGIPIAQAVELNGERMAGGNPDARRARGLATLTARPLILMAPPDEDWVVLTYRADGRVQEARFDWQVEIAPAAEPQGVAAPDSALASVLGLDVLMESVNRARRAMFKPQSLELERRMTHLHRRGRAGLRAAAADPELADQSLLPSNFDYRTVQVEGRAFGYIRIWSFNKPPSHGDTPQELQRFLDDFVNEFIRLLGLLPPDGLILDVRNNPGGVIMAGERLLQLLTPRHIEPARFQFLCSPLTRTLCEGSAAFQPWEQSVREAVETGAAYSREFPITEEEPQTCNGIGQVYHGPVVLITDALCYSTTDIFAAGFQDHEIGPVLGVASRTGAGGANVWGHEYVLGLPGSAALGLKALPGGARFCVAVRRALRVGKRAGVLLEDLGVEANDPYAMTREDLLEENRLLIAHAAELIRHRPARVLAAEVQWGAAGPAVTVTTRGLTRLDVYFDGRPRQSRDVADGEVTLDLGAVAPGTPHVLDLRGFEGEQLVAARKVPC